MVLKPKEKSLKISICQKDRKGKETGFKPDPWKVC
jgi:hypothetical protein